MGLSTAIYSALILSFGLSVLAEADSIQVTLPSGDYPHMLGAYDLTDPAGATHTEREVAKKVCIVIFSVPDMDQGDLQQTWSDLLGNKPETKMPDTVAFLLIEDISQAGFFKDMALDGMKKQFTPQSRPMVLMDQDGSFSKKFALPADSTEIFIYDKKGVLRDVETKLGEDDQDATVARIKAITQILQAEQ